MYYICHTAHETSSDMETLQKVIASLPHGPGVYIYKNRSGSVLYVGKAKDLYKRVHQYFQKGDLLDSKTKILVSQIHSIDIVQTANEFDAIFLEAKLIHDYAPKYNIILKDDKTPLYIILTVSEELPHVYIRRRSDIAAIAMKEDIIFGPFQSAKTLRSVMRYIRHITPYCTQNRRTGQSCFYAHIGLCHPCPSAITKTQLSEGKNMLIHEYRKNIYRLRDILSGKSAIVLLAMEKEMKSFAREQKYEDAQRMKQHIDNLDSLMQKKYDPSVYIESSAALDAITQTELDALRAFLSPYISSLQYPHRIECVDISNIQGMYSAGSLVVLTDGKIDTRLYKRFRIRQEHMQNDIRMMHEVLLRRFRHTEWDMPDLLVVDGGKPQVHTAQNVLSDLGLSIPVIGLAKRYEEIIIPVGTSWKILHIPPTNPAVHILQRIRDEAHRFALSYHQLLRKKV